MNGEKQFEVKWIPDDMHWGIVNASGRVVQRFQASCVDDAHRFCAGVNYVGYRYVDESLDYGDGSDPFEGV